MLQPGEDAALVPEALQDRVGVDTAFDQLDGNALFKSLVGATRKINGAHPAAADLADDAVAPQFGADHGVGGSLVVKETGGGALDNTGNEGTLLLVPGQQAGDFLAQFRVVAALLLQM